VKEYPNFYENMEECYKRLRNTVVLYDGRPYRVHGIGNNRPDGIFRMYLMPLVGLGQKEYQSMPNPMNYTIDSSDFGNAMDEFMKANKDTPVLRKQINSPLFNKFRPFPLGMCNSDGNTYYLERTPNRKTEQGLIATMISESIISTAVQSNAGKMPYGNIALFSKEFEACVMADFPPAVICLKALTNPSIDNTAVAFHRYFALCRGPIDTLFLAYKADIVGVLPNNDFSRLKLGKEFEHTREVVEDLHLFNQIVM
jgi:hypothetical protein